MKNNIAIIEDDILLARLMQEKINELDNYHCDKIYQDPIAFLNDPNNYDIVLLDIVMSEMNGLDAIEKIQKKNPKSAIVMNTIKDDSDTIFKALQLGALGYIDKQSFDMNFVDVFDTIENGGAYMTPKIARKVINYFHLPYPRSHVKLEILTKRETDIANGILDGLSYQAIADRYGIAIDTVRMNVKKIYRKLEINSKGELFKMAQSKK